MQTRLILVIDKTEYILNSDELQNWDDIRCSYKRDELSGVVRSFSSKFQFVGRAYDLVFGKYLADESYSTATVTMQILDNSWKWRDVFTSDLDFSTLQTSDGVLSISAIDDSMAALVKANKGTTYEMVVGEDVPVSRQLYYVPLPLRETATYEFTEGVSFDNRADIRVEYSFNQRIFVGNVGSEIVVNRVVKYNDDQTNDLDSCVLEAYKDIQVRFHAVLEYSNKDSDFNSPNKLYVCVERNGAIISYEQFAQITNQYSPNPIGSYVSMDDLLAAYPTPPNQYAWASINGRVAHKETGVNRWYLSEQSFDIFFRRKIDATVDLNLSVGDKVVIATDPSGKNIQAGFFYIFTQSLEFSWLAKGEVMNMDLIRPIDLIQGIINKIYDGASPAHAYISDFDQRLIDTYILAGESVRGIDGAKIYSSLSDFCDWMETVFGYVYYIGPQAPPFSKQYNAGRFLQRSDYNQIYSTAYIGSVVDDNIRYDKADGCFYYLNGTARYKNWPNCTNYNSYENENMPRARRDAMFNITDEDGEKKIVYFIDGTNEPQILGDCMHFVHRTELFDEDQAQITIARAVEVEYSVDNQRIYSAVDIGYEKKDYDCLNGRDEFNFNIEYATGCTASSKKLSMRSKYRADCYGLEFLSLKRGQKTSDTTSDKNIFFMQVQGEGYVVERKDSAPIDGVLSQYVYNGEFSPRACALANAEYIGCQAPTVTLRFASSGGNSDVVINGESLKEDVVITDRLVSVGELTFTSDAVEAPENLNALISVKSGGFIYTGYLAEAEYQLAKTEAVKYTILVKSVEPCV